jgi:hypothetical protein
MSQEKKKDESYLEKRRHIRVDYRVNAEITYGDKSYRGNIENISESGIFKVAFPEKEIVDLIPGSPLVVKFQGPSGEDFNLNCLIKWLRIYTISPFALKYNMGIEIVNAPQEYRDFVEQLILNVKDPSHCAPN